MADVKISSFLQPQTQFRSAEVTSLCVLETPKNHQCLAYGRLATGVSSGWSLWLAHIEPGRRQALANLAVSAQLQTGIWRAKTAGLSAAQHISKQPGWNLQWLTGVCIPVAGLAVEESSILLLPSEEVQWCQKSRNQTLPHYLSASFIFKISRLACRATCWSPRDSDHSRGEPPSRAPTAGGSRELPCTARFPAASGLGDLQVS